MSDLLVDVPLGTTAAQLQTMIDAAAAGTTFVLQAGTYVFDQTVTIDRSDISLIGQGAGETVIQVSEDIGDAPAIVVGLEVYKSDVAAEDALAEAASVGDAAITLAAGHDVQVGDYIYLAAENTDAYFEEIGDEQWRKSNPLRTIMVEVTSVDGDTVGFDTPLTFDFDPALTTVETRNLITGNTLSGFTMQGPWGEADPGAFWNGAGEGQTMIVIGGTAGAVATDIAIEDGISNGILFHGSIDATLDGFSMDGAANKGGGGNGYGVWIRDVYESSFTELTVTDTRHAVVFASYTTASGNDVHVTHTNRDVNFHGGRDQYNTVVVDSMVRDETEQGYMAWATFYNEGERYGAPTDPTTNPIVFRTLVASSKGDEAHAHDDGAEIWMVGGADIVHGGAGDDYINGGSGGDTIYASDGEDMIDGDSSSDTLILSGLRADYTVTADGADLYLAHDGGRMLVRNVESFVFADGTWSEDALLADAGVEAAPRTAPAPVIPYERVEDAAADDGAADDAAADDGATDDAAADDAATGDPATDDASTDDAAAQIALPSFTLRFGSIWSSGFTAYIDVVNDTDAVIEDFQILISSPSFTVSKNWSSELTEQADGDLLFTGLSWAKNMEPGESVTLGFNGAGTPPEEAALTYIAMIDGVAYTLGEDAPADDAPADDGATDDGATDDGATDGGAADDGATDDSTADDGTTDDTATDDGTTDGGAADDGATDDSTADDSTADDSTADDGATDDSTADDGATDDTATDDGASDDTASDDTASDSGATDGVVFEITEDWGDGFNGRVTLTNTSSAVMEDFALSFAQPGFTVRNAWGAVATVDAAGDLVFSGADWTLDLAPGETQSFGFTADGTVPTDAPDMTLAPVYDLPEAAFEITNSWNGGFNGRITVTNDTDAAVDSFSILVEDAGFTVRNVWGALVAHDAGDVTFTADEWTLDLDPGETQSFGFTADGIVPTEGLELVLSVDGATGSGTGTDAGTDDGTDTGTDTGAGTGADDGTGTGTDDGTDTGADDGTDTGTDAGTGDAAAFGAADYGTALDLSMQFYYAQYSGDLAEDFPLSWRGDSALSDGADVGLDLTGGWYDAGDHVKFGLPMAFSATMLAWGAADYAEGYEAAGATADILTHLAWVTDYFLRCYDDGGTEDLSDDVFYAQVGDPYADHSYWVAPEDMTMDRPAYAVTAGTPGSEVTAETAAALASASIVFRDAGDAAYADTLLAAAEKLYAFAETYQGTYTAAVSSASDFYNSWSGYRDELSWGAAWLYEATGDAVYLDLAESYYPGGSTYWALSWDDKSNGVAMMLAEITGDGAYVADIDAHLSYVMNDLTRTPGTDTNDGLAWLDQWGSNRYAANMAFLAVERADLAEAQGDAAWAADLIDFASDQVDYMLGDNPDGQSYVVGFGETYPLNPHHRAASGVTDLYASGDNLYELTGALVGGPAADGSYEDLRWDYVQNEVATDYNAGFSGALAGLIVDDLTG